MTRPSAEVIMTCESGMATLAILRAPQMWVVLYKNQPFGARKTYYNSQSLNPMVKYLKTTFTSASPAHTLSMKLNEHFNCTDFTVSEIL